MRQQPSLRGVRGAVSGLWCGLGAMVAHRLAGGEGEPLLAVAVLPLAIALCTVLVRRRPDPARVAAVALLSQLALHGLLMVAGTPEESGPALPMLLGHLLVAAGTAAVCAGADRLLLGLARGLVDRLLPGFARPAAVRAPRTARVGVGVLLEEGRVARRPAAPRGPPARPLLPVLP